MVIQVFLVYSQKVDVAVVVDVTLVPGLHYLVVSLLIQRVSTVLCGQDQ